MKIKYAPFKPTQRNTSVRGSSNSNTSGSVMDRLGGAPVYVFKIPFTYYFIR